MTAGFLISVEAELTQRLVDTQREFGVYPDAKDNLMWAAADNGRDIDWKRAVEYCQELELAGYDDWRLPEIDELETLHRKMSTAIFKVPEEVRLSACCQWSASRLDQDSLLNFNFRFRKRFAGSAGYSYDLRALCVRDYPLGEQVAYEQWKLAREVQRQLERAEELALESGRRTQAPEPEIPDG